MYKNHQSEKSALCFFMPIFALTGMRSILPNQRNIQRMEEEKSDSIPSRSDKLSAGTQKHRIHSVYLCALFKKGVKHSANLPL